MSRVRISLAVAAATLFTLSPAQAQTQVQWWHAMSGPLGEWVNDLAKEYNASQKDYVVIPTFKGTYGETLTAAMAAFRAGNAPDILQVYEVGTATMMAAKGAIKPVGEVMTMGGAKFDAKVYIPAVAGYYTAPNGQLGRTSEATRRLQQRERTHDAKLHRYRYRNSLRPRIGLL